MKNCANEIGHCDGSGVDLQPECWCCKWSLACASLFFGIAVDQCGQCRFPYTSNACQDDGCCVGLCEFHINLFDCCFALLDSSGIGRWRNSNHTAISNLACRSL